METVRGVFMAVKIVTRRGMESRQSEKDPDPDFALFGRLKKVTLGV